MQIEPTQLTDKFQDISIAQPKRSYLQQSYIIPNYPPTKDYPPLKGKPCNKLLNGYLKLIKIGQGPFSQIKLTYNIHQKKYFAMKKYNLFVMKKKTKMFRDPETNKIRYGNYGDDVIKEIQVWKKASLCKNIAKLYDIIKDKQEEKIYLFTQFCAKGDIAKWNSKKKIFEHTWNFKQLINLFSQVAQGLFNLHTLNIVHRDIKPLNLLVNENNQIRMIDFGLSVILKDQKQRLVGTVGTYHFNAPEMLSQKEQGGYDGKKSDIWALGVSFFSLVFKTLPFYHELQIKLFQQIQEGNYHFPDVLPQGAQYIVPLIKKMLLLQPKERPTAKQAYLYLLDIQKSIQK